MAAGPENTFIGSVHKHLPPGLYRMKNHNAYNGGIADCWYSGAARDLWIEYKFIVIPKNPGTLIDLTGGKSPALSHLQQDWLRTRHQEGRNVAVVVGSKDGGVWLTGTLWEYAYSADWFRKSLLSRKEVAEVIHSFVSVRHG